jgi:hypothetical protein
MDSTAPTAGESERRSPPDVSGMGTGHRCSAACAGVFDDHRFALCLTHDVDRVYKTYQSLYDAVTDRRLSHLAPLLSDSNPYWQFEEIMQIEEKHGVRSSFYFLNEKRLLREKSPTDWFDPRNWTRYTGHYDVTEPAIAEVIRDLDDGGWEVGLHGSYDSYTDPDRLEAEKERLESVLGHRVTGGRQHFLNLHIPETWHHHQEVGLKYDASLGSSSAYGFGTTVTDSHGTDPVRARVGGGVVSPFGDDFLVFPLTVMEATLVESAGSVDAAWAELRQLLAEARRRRAVVTVLWHPRLFSERDFPGYRQLYERLLVEAKSLDAWIGPVEDAYRELSESPCRRDVPDAAAGISRDGRG